METSKVSQIAYIPVMLQHLARTVAMNIAQERMAQKV